MNELMKRIAASSIAYEFFEESNGGMSVELFENCIDLYTKLCDGNKEAINQCIEAIMADEENGFEYFYESDATAFLDRYNR